MSLDIAVNIDPESMAEFNALAERAERACVELAALLKAAEETKREAISVPVFSVSQDPDAPRSAEIDRVKQALDAYREPILRYFTFAHLLDPLMRAMSEMCCSLAEYAHANLPRCPERAAGLRKLLEAKDCFVRALVPVEVNS